MTYEYWRERQVRDATKLSRTTRWRMENQGNFPARRQLSANAVGWLRSEVEAWVISRQPVFGRQS
ncbi:MAG: AlpA family phage regulatory protein [Candidatus Accumulibacter sp. UW26]|jgi:prophage regulatory protein